MNIKEFKEWLNQFDDDVIVEVGIQQRAPSYQSFGEVIFEEFVGDEYEDYDYLDFTNNQFVTDDKPYWMKKYLRLGMEN